MGSCCEYLAFGSCEYIQSPSCFKGLAVRPNTTRIKSLDIKCFHQKPQQHKSDSNDDQKNSGRPRVFPYWLKKHRSMTRRILELSKRRQLNQALQILDDAILNNYRPNRKVMNSALAACVHCGDLSRAQVIFENMLQPGNCGVDDVTYTILLKGLGENKMLDEAFEIVEALEKGTAPGGAVLTEAHLRTLLNAFADAGEMMRARGILARYRSMFSQEGLSIFTYNILIKGYSRSSNPMEALKLREDIKRLGLQPDRITYNSLILACVRGGDMKEALQIFREMKENAERLGSKELLPDFITYSTLIQGLGEHGMLDSLICLAKEFRGSKECTIDRIAYGVLIDAFLSTGSSSGMAEGLSIFEEMIEIAKERKDMRPKPHVFLSLMRAFTEHGEFETVKRLHSEMVPFASGPVSPQIRVEADELLFEAAVNNGQLALARQLLKDMKALRKGMPFSSRAFLAIIRLDLLSNFENSVFQPYVLKDGISVDDPVEKWMETIEESKPLLPDVLVSEVVLQFFRHAAVPIVDKSGSCIGVVHREDCYELNAKMGTIMRGPPPSIPANTSIGKAVTLLLNTEVKMVSVLEISEDLGFAKDVNKKVIGFLTLERVLSLRVDYKNLLTNKIQQFITDSTNRDDVM